MEIRSGEESTWFLDQVEEKFNVRIVPNGVYHGDKEKVSLLLATGECPDLFCPGDPYDTLAQGLTRTIPVEMIHEHAPQYTKLLNDFYPIGWLLGQSPDDPGDYVALTAVSTTHAYGRDGHHDRNRPDHAPRPSAPTLS